MNEQYLTDHDIPLNEQYLTSKIKYSILLIVECALSHVQAILNNRRSIMYYQGSYQGVWKKSDLFSMNWHI